MVGLVIDVEKFKNGEGAIVENMFEAMLDGVAKKFTQGIYSGKTDLLNNLILYGEQQ